MAKKLGPPTIFHLNNIIYTTWKIWFQISAQTSQTQTVFMSHITFFHIFTNNGNIQGGPSFCLTLCTIVEENGQGWFGTYTKQYCSIAMKF